MIETLAASWLTDFCREFAAAFAETVEKDENARGLAFTFLTIVASYPAYVLVLLLRKVPQTMLAGTYSLCPILFRYGFWYSGRCHRPHRSISCNSGIYYSLLYGRWLQTKTKKGEYK